VGNSRVSTGLHRYTGEYKPIAGRDRYCDDVYDQGGDHEPGNWRMAEDHAPFIDELLEHLVGKRRRTERLDWIHSQRSGRVGADSYMDSYRRKYNSRHVRLCYHRDTEYQWSIQLRCDGGKRQKQCRYHDAQPEQWPVGPGERLLDSDCIGLADLPIGRSGNRNIVQRIAWRRSDAVGAVADR
jgi:hypothetical protein